MVPALWAVWTASVLFRNTNVYNRKHLRNPEFCYKIKHDLNLATNGIKTGVFLLNPSACLCHAWYHLQREKCFWPSTARSHDMPAAGVLQALFCLPGVNFVCEETQQNANLVFSINLQSQIRTFSDPFPLSTHLQNCKQKCGLMISSCKFWKPSEWESASNPNHWVDFTWDQAH